MDVLEQKRMGQDRRPQVAVRDFIRCRGSRDEFPTTGTPVAMMPKAGHLHPGGDEVFLEVFADVHRCPQRGLAPGAPAQRLINDPVDVVRFGPGHTGMPGLLARALGTPLQERGEPVQATAFGRAELLDEALDSVLERWVLALKFRHQSDQLPLREFLNFLAEILSDGALSSGSGSTLLQVQGIGKKNFGGLNRYLFSTSITNP